MLALDVCALNNKSFVVLSMHELAQSICNSLFVTIFMLKQEFIKRCDNQ
uniref:Uncharacterized protein n=1 Tax=Rhizophora mucronata TaxID=61149 RepID=A0A2P2LLJ5_RHIMU